MALPFSEWSREAKDEFAQKRMEEMKLKNEAFKQRYAEVEQDRIKAEAKDSAVTSVKISKKESINIEKEKVEDIPKVTKEREWDKGKIDQDADDWSPPKFHGYRSRAQRRNFPDRRAPKKEENWRVRSANLSKDRQSYSKFRSSGPNHKYQESSNYGTSGFRNETASFSRQRGRAHRASSGTYRSFQNSRFDEPRKKSISGGAGSASPSLSESELEPVKHQAKPEVARTWQDVGITEVLHKQSRVEKWVKAINTTTSWNEEYDNTKGNDYYTEKRDEAGPQDAVKSYGYANEEGYPKKAQSSRDQAHLKNRERYDGLKHGQSLRGNSRARGSRTPTGERTVGGFENKNQRDFRKRNYGDKNRFRRESDLSDRTSSMKESDYHDCSKDKFNKTTSDSKSSEEECEFKYASEKKPFDKQSSARNYGKDKFNKPKSVRPTSVSGSQDGMKKDNFDDEYSRNTRQKFPNSYVKDQQLDNRPPGPRKVDYSFNKVKSNKYKTESKFMGHSGKFENESAADNHARASRKYKMSKPSPKRTLSNPVKSVDTSSSASKTMEFNSPDDELWGDIDDSNCSWKNDSVAERKSSLLEEEVDVNKVSQPLDSSTPLKTDCDTNSEKFYKKSELENDEVRSGDAVLGEFHDDELCSNIDDSNCSWKNGSPTERKSSLLEEEADMNKVSQPLDSPTPLKTDCNASSEKFYKKSELENDEVRSGDAVPGEFHDDNKTREFNSPDDEFRGNIEDSNCSWKNSSLAEHKSSLLEEEAGMNKVSQPLDSSTPLKTDCDINSEKFYKKSELKNDEVRSEDADPGEFHEDNKTMEFNPPDDELCGNIDDSHCNWKNSSLAERKSSLLEEETDMNKVSLPLDSSTPLKTDCDASSDNFSKNSELKHDEVRSGDAIPGEFNEDNNVGEHDIEVEGKEILISLEDLIESSTGKNTAGVAEDQKLKPNDPVNNKDGEYIVSSTCLNESSEIKKLVAETDCNVLTDEKHEGSYDIEYSEDQNKADVKVQKLGSDGVNSPTSDVVSSSVDSCESKNPVEIVTKESKSSLPEVSVSEVQNSQGRDVQSTETDQSCNKFPNNAKLEHLDLEVAQKEISANDASPCNADCETPVEPTVENDIAATVHSEIKALSSQSVNTASTNDESESALKSSDIVAANLQSPKHEGNDNENSSVALNLSDDGEWSTVSDDKNNDASGVEKTKQASNSANKSENLT